MLLGASLLANRAFALDTNRHEHPPGKHILRAQSFSKGTATKGCPLCFLQSHVSSKIWCSEITENGHGAKLPESLADRLSRYVGENIAYVPYFRVFTGKADSALSGQKGM